MFRALLILASVAVVPVVSKWDGVFDGVPEKLKKSGHGFPGHGGHGHGGHGGRGLSGHGGHGGHGGYGGHGFPGKRGQGPQRPRGPPPPWMTPSQFISLEQLDTDSDDKISRDELTNVLKDHAADAVTKAFIELDSDDDTTTLTAEEAKSRGHYLQGGPATNLHSKKFDEVDANSDGKHDKEEAVKALEKLMEDQLEKAFAAQDKDSDGEISADEFDPAPFHRLFVDKVLFYRKKQFVNVDKDADGSHTKEEVRSLLQLENEERMTAILKEGDADEDGAVTFDEFMAQAKAKAEKHVQEKDEKFEESPEFKKAFSGAMDGTKSADDVKAAASKSKHRQQAREKQREGFLKHAESKAMAQFERYDKDSDKSLTESELKAYFDAQVDAEIEKQFKRLDKDEDGIVMMSEFLYNPKRKTDL